MLHSFKANAFAARSYIPRFGVRTVISTEINGPLGHGAPLRIELGVRLDSANEIRRDAADQDIRPIPAESVRQAGNESDRQFGNESTTRSNAAATVRPVAGRSSRPRTLH